jgi:chemotaxis protein methyltransferase CheR
MTPQLISASIPGRATGASSEQSALRQLADRVTQDLGIRMPDAKLTMLNGRVQRRLRALELSSIEAYLEQLERAGDSEDELIHFYDLATTNKTDFFREAAHFEHLVSTAVPSVLDARSRTPGPLRVWCAGCSTGPELYTLAIVLNELARVRRGLSFELTATDISTRALKVAASGTYPEEMIAPVPAELRTRYLLRSRDRSAGLVRVAPELRHNVEIRRLNFMDEVYDLPSDFDVVFFRNVLIYFDRPTQAKVVSRICKHLRPEGFLYIAHSESLAGLPLPLYPVATSVLRRTP